MKSSFENIADFAFQTGTYSPEGHAQGIAHAAALDLLHSSHGVPAVNTSSDVPMTHETKLMLNDLARKFGLK